MKEGAMCYLCRSAWREKKFIENFDGEAFWKAADWKTERIMVVQFSDKFYGNTILRGMGDRWNCHAILCTGSLWFVRFQSFGSYYQVVESTHLQIYQSEMHILTST
jgi:hypothetical protein